LLTAVTVFKVPPVFALEADLVNINFFLELVAGFSQRNRTYPATLQGLIRFAEEHKGLKISNRRIGRDRPRSVC
jgi:hypothetical protein